MELCDKWDKVLQSSVHQSEMPKGPFIIKIGKGGEHLNILLFLSLHSPQVFRFISEGLASPLYLKAWHSFSITYSDSLHSFTYLNCHFKPQTKQLGSSFELFVETLPSSKLFQAFTDGSILSIKFWSLCSKQL